MFDGTYLNNLHSIGNYEALYVIVAPPDIQNELDGGGPLLTGNMVAEIHNGAAIILGPGDSWGACLDYLNLYPEDLDLPEYANLCLDWTVDDSMSMTLLDQHVLISGETSYTIGSGGVDLVSIYLPNMHASEPYRCPVGPVATSCV